MTPLINERDFSNQADSVNRYEKFTFYYTRIFGALTGPKILAGTAPIKVGSARLVLVVLVACFEFLSGIVTHQRLYQICKGKT